MAGLAFIMPSAPATLASPAASGTRGTTARLLLQEDVGTSTEACEGALVWSASSDGSHSCSLTAYIETNSEEIRRRYLAWSHDLSETVVLGRRLRERFNGCEGASLWFQSMFFEQSTWKQESLEPLLKLLALETLLDAERPALLEFAGANRRLSQAVRAMCYQRGIRFRFLPRPRTPPRRDWRRRVRQLPASLLALGALVRLARRSWRLRKAPLRRAGAATRRALFCGPFFQYAIDRADPPSFRSMYWARLPEVLATHGWRIEWLHYYFRHEKLPEERAASTALERLNADGRGSEPHSFVESYLRVGQMPDILWHWLRICVESVLVGLVLHWRFVRRRDASHWPLIRRDWAEAFRGYSCVENLYFGKCFDEALRQIPRQDEGLYLMENQGWERALARAWRRYGHGRLTAVAHSTVRYWDLRYHCDPRRYGAAYRRSVPGPDVVALNGPAAREEYQATCAEREPLVDCEALRYLELGSAGMPRATDATRDAGIRLLVVGDYTAPRSEAMLQLVKEALRGQSLAIEVWLKPHPACPPMPTSPGTDVPRTVEEPLAKLLPQVDLVFASNTTSAALEAYLGGVNVIVHDDGSSVNYSPLRGLAGVPFVGSAEALRCALQRAGARGGALPQRQSFFSMDPGLPRWRRYLGLDRSECR